MHEHGSSCGWPNSKSLTLWLLHPRRELVNQKLCAAHPHIVHLREAFLTPHHLGIAMEFADSGDLLDFIDTFAAQVGSGFRAQAGARATVRVRFHALIQPTAIAALTSATPMSREIALPIKQSSAVSSASRLHVAWHVCK